MEKIYKCDSCNSESKDNSEMCCNRERKEVKNSISAKKHKCDMEHIWPGIKAGLIAGIVFGAMMAMAGFLPKIASLFGSKSIVVGLIGHFAISATIGASFGLLFGHKATKKGKGIVLGLFWGFIWWILGPVLIMPIWLGLGLNLTTKGLIASLGSLPGHLVFGFILGLVYVLSVNKKD